jgi:hypothetical protein
MLVSLSGLVPGCTSPAAQFNDAPGRMSKIAPELFMLYEDYSTYLASPSHGAFKSSSPLLQIIDDRVIIDAVASENTNVLKSDLEALGMQQAVVFGRVVSGQLPILAIREMATLPSLSFARAATAVLQGAPGSVTPRNPKR